MNKLLIGLISFIISSYSSFGQGTVRGVVSDENGELVYDVKVFVKENKLLVTKTDFDGKFSLDFLTDQPQTLIFYLAEFDTLRQIIELKNKEIKLLNFTITTKKKELEEFVLVAKINKANENHLEKIKIKSATSIDFISNQQMKLIGDPNAVSAISRVSGVSSSGGLITVRGIGDRYVKTTLNGSRIPTLDPLTNNIKLDIFPASLIDNIVITKTASPDLPADWSGAYISIETKDYPGKLEVNVESQFGYNNQTTFKDVISSQRSSTDWLGYDNGFRNTTISHFDAPKLNPTQYEEMSALGLTDYYKSIGVNGWTDGSPESDTYFKLGLVELGILPKALMNDQAAFSNAKTEYNETYKSQAFSIINPEGKDYNNGLSNSWGTVKRKAPLNYTQSFSIGEQVKLFGRPFGYIVGFRYGTSTRYTGNGISQRVGAEQLNYPFDVKDVAEISRETNGWNALLNLNYTLNENTKIGFLYMPNYTGTNDVAKFSTKYDNTVTQEGRVQNNIFYEQRKQNVFQLNVTNFIPKHKIKIDFNSSYTLGASIAPDFKILQYGFIKENGEITSYAFGPTLGDGIRRFYRYLNENISDSRISAEIPIDKNEKKLIRKLKFGSAFQHLDRKQDLSQLNLDMGNNSAITMLANDNIDDFLSPSNMIMTNQKINFFYNSGTDEKGKTFGKSSIFSYYGMTDYEISKELRFSGGLRIEHTHIFTDVVKFYNLGYEKDDVRRAATSGLPTVNAANITKANFLPSINLIYKWDIIDSAQTNLRLNFSQTVARPSIRELSPAAVYDNEFRTFIYGNSDLKMVQIQNYDFRAESYLKNGDNVSVSLFYKNFKNHIELGFGSAGITWQNIDQSSVKGFEFEGKKNVGKSFEIRANVTLVKSVSKFVNTTFETINGVKVYTYGDTVTRPMFGQAPYIINGTMVYKADKIGLTASISYNIQGPRLVITGIIKGFPDVYEMPRNTIDLKVSKKLGDHFSASINIRDLLNAPVRRAYKLPTEWVDYDRYRYGTNYTLGISYNL